MLNSKVWGFVLILFFVLGFMFLMFANDGSYGYHSQQLASVIMIACLIIAVISFFGFFAARQREFHQARGQITPEQQPPKTQ